MDTRTRELNEAARLLRKFRKLPKEQQQRQANRLLAEQRHLNNTVYERRVHLNEKTGNFPISGNREYLKTGRGILFPVGVKTNGSLILKTEDVDFLARWLQKHKTNPWTRQRVGEPTLPTWVYRAVLKKAGIAEPNNTVAQKALETHFKGLIPLLNDNPDFTFDRFRRMIPPSMLNHITQSYLRYMSNTSDRRHWEELLNIQDDLLHLAINAGYPSIVYYDSD